MKHSKAARFAGTPLLLFAFGVACRTAPPVAPRVAPPATEPAADLCTPRVDRGNHWLLGLQPDERSKRVQAALKLKYARRKPQPAEERPADAPEDDMEHGLTFVLVPKRWGADGPVPWEEIALPELQAAVGPAAFYLTELATEELEYPWVQVLVVAREQGDVLELSGILSPSFTNSAPVLSRLFNGACAPSPKARAKLTLAALQLYALGNADGASRTLQDGSCTVAPSPGSGDVWRYIAVDFSASGAARNVYTFNPLNEDDTAQRAAVCGQ